MQLPLWSNVGHFNLKLISDTSNRWHSGWSKNIVFHDLASLEGVGDVKIDCALKKQQNTYIFDQHNSGCWKYLHINREGFQMQF